MSTHREDKLLDPYWKQRGGTLIRELMLRPSRRRADGIIDLDGPFRDHKGSEFWRQSMSEIIAGKRLVCIEVKPDSSTLDYAAIGQLLCAFDLIKPHQPSSLEGVILAGYDEPYLSGVAKWLGFEVITVKSLDKLTSQPAYHDISGKPRGKRQALVYRRIQNLFDEIGGTLYTDVYLSRKATRKSRIDAIIDPAGKREHIKSPDPKSLEGNHELIGIVALPWTGEIDRPTTGKAVCAKRLIEEYLKPEKTRVIIGAEACDPNHTVTLDNHGIEIMAC